MMTVGEKFKEMNASTDLFYPFYPKRNEGGVSEEEQQKMKVEALYDGLFTLFSTSNGTFLEHIRLAFMYPLLRLAAIVVNFITLDWPATILHCIALPLTIAYWLIGLVTRSIATVIDALFPTNSQDEFDCIESIRR